MKQMIRRSLSRLLKRLVRYPRIKWMGQRLLGRFPRLRSTLMRLMHGGPLLASPPPVNAFDTRGESQQRLLEELEQRWTTSK